MHPSADWHPVEDFLVRPGYRRTVIAFPGHGTMRCALRGDENSGLPLGTLMTFRGPGLRPGQREDKWVRDCGFCRYNGDENAHWFIYVRRDDGWHAWYRGLAPCFQRTIDKGSAADLVLLA